MDHLILGIDDAGRGPVIGPMILAGCLVDKKTSDDFKKEGVKDSKQLTQKRREVLEIVIKEKSKGFETILITPEEIDKGNEEGTNLNELEAIASAKIINKLNNGDKKIAVVVDCPSVSICKWTETLKMHIDNLSNLEISCEHKADRNHPSVSAASILAKSERERQVKKLKEKYGEDMGSGYPSDPLTKKFLAKNATKHKGLFRKSWKTWQKASSESKQKKLF
ncbi:MAG TPA: ribonuclease HII [Candidatus Pacearchaeota archaeon]|nr:ribonuclease HII [Candidatus Pacearchaeota archaeon]